MGGRVMPQKGGIGAIVLTALAAGFLLRGIVPLNPGNSIPALIIAGFLLRSMVNDAFSWTWRSATTLTIGIVSVVGMQNIPQIIPDRGFNSLIFVLIGYPLSLMFNTSEDGGQAEDKKNVEEKPSIIRWLFWDVEPLLAWVVSMGMIHHFTYPQTTTGSTLESLITSLTLLFMGRHVLLSILRKRGSGKGLVFGIILAIVLSVGFYTKIIGVNLDQLITVVGVGMLLVITIIGQRLNTAVR